ncbi:MAG TPA: hypothetical protein VEH84_00185 [Alphaproteobacteria bacterium]|nr:hypothetical protein [Alphaproteobacteria bacterium]
MSGHPPHPQNAINTLEHGTLALLYQPRHGVTVPYGIEDIQRLWMVLAPRGVLGQCRLIALSPEDDARGTERPRFRAVVDQLAREADGFADRLAGEADAAGTAHPGPAAQMLGQGCYRIVLHLAHTHLLYLLEPTHFVQQVGELFGLTLTGNFILSVRQPAAPAVLPADPPQLLDNFAAELSLAPADGHALVEQGDAAAVLNAMQGELKQALDPLYPNLGG